MARPLRLEFPGALFHICSRGNAKQRIFFDDGDRRLFLDLLGECVTRFEWIAYAYALMPNHFHLLIQLTKETLSRGMQWLNGSYAIAFNRRHERVGHVLQGRFKSPLVEKETHLLQLIRYIVLNPVRAHIVKRPEDARWTSYRAMLGLTEAPSWLAVDDVLLPFGTQRDVARAAFRDFVDAGIGIESSAWKDLVDKSYIGSDPWVARIDEQIRLKPRSSEHPFEQRMPNRRSMSEIVATVSESWAVDPARVRCGIERTPRMIAAWLGWNECLLTASEIGADLRLSRSAVSQLVKKCDVELDRNDDLRHLVSTIGRKLKSGDLTPT